MLMIHSSQDLKPYSSNFYRTQVYLGSDLWVPVSLTHSLQHPFADLTEVTLADEDTNSILAENDNRAIQGNFAGQVSGF